MACPCYHVRPGHGVVCGDGPGLRMDTCAVDVDLDRDYLSDLCALFVGVHVLSYDFSTGCGSVPLGFLCGSFGGHLAVAGGRVPHLELVGVDRDLVKQNASVVADHHCVNRPL